MTKTRLVNERIHNRTVQDKKSRYYTIYKQRAISDVIGDKVLHEMFYMAERPIDGMTGTQFQAKTPEQLARNIVVNDISRDGETPEYRFNFDVYTNHESVEPRYRLDESEARRFLDGITEARKDAVPERRTA